MVNRWLQALESWMMPPSCVLCGDRGQAPLLDLCRPCAGDLPRNLDACPRCARPEAAGAGAEPCGRCQRRAPAFDRVIAPYLYDYPIDRLIQAFKYGDALSYGRVLGTLLAQHLCAGCEPLPEALVPVPLYPARRRERGFNQAYELARPVAELLGLPIEMGLCHRRRATAEQTALGAAERRRNVRGAFGLQCAPAYTHLALVDDVFTTGSTTQELARVLKRAGVRRVEVWALARAAVPGSLRAQPADSRSQLENR